MISTIEAMCAIAVDRTGSFRRAASELFLSQPAVSSYVARLERHLGVVLFVRSSQGATTTAAGRIVLERLQELLDANARTENECRRIASGSSPIVSVASQRIGLVDLLPEALATVKRTFPNITISTEHVADGDVRDYVVDQAVSIGLGYRVDGHPLPHPAVDEVVLKQATNVLYVARSHQLAHRAEVVADDLRGETLVTIKSPIAEDFIGDYVRGLDGITWCRVDDSEVGLAMVSAGVGVMLSLASIAYERAAGVVGVPLGNAPLVEITVARSAARQLDPAADLLWRLLIGDLESSTPRG